MAKKRGKIKSKKIKFSNKWLYTLIVIGILAILSVGVYAVLTLIDIGHPQEEIIVSIDNCNVILQNAISNEWLKDLPTSTLSSSDCLSESEFPKTYHLASEIIVTINSYTLTLQDAINQNYFKGTGTISSSTSLPSMGHLADKVEVTISGTKKTLQEALSDLKYTCVSNYNQDCPSGNAACINLGKIQCDGTCSGSYKSADTSCGTNMKCDESGNCVWAGECTPGQIRTKDCDYLDTICRNYEDVTDTCDATGYWTNPSCDSYTDTAKGTDCVIGDTKTCDGSGNCIGWPEPPPGLGCGACPFGMREHSITTGFYRFCLMEDNQARWSWSSTSGWSSWSYIGWMSGGTGVPCRHKERYCDLRIIFCLRWRTRYTDVYWEIKP